jgi:BirA family biotin operon repressor/biotin-[acetyl-CoA-carboxylase] ligase
VSNPAGKNDRPAVVIGVGLNVNSTLADFSSELQPIVTTLFEQTGQRMDLEKLLDLLVQAIASKAAMVATDSEFLLAEWQKHDYLHGRPLVHTAGNVTLQGIGMGVSALGLYRFRDAAGVEHSVVGGQLRLA